VLDNLYIFPIYGTDIPVPDALYSLIK
jgi:hypothetical protein